jgi:Secretion system C-terminal sorting domain
MICHGQTLILGQNAPDGFNYSWNGGTLGSKILPTNHGGQYILTISTAPGCVSKDTVLVDFCLQSLLPSDTSTCKENLYVSTGLYGLDNQWNDGYNGSTRCITQSGDYQVTITNLHGESITDSIHVDIYDLAINGTVDVQGHDIFVEPTNGYAPFQYKWSNGATSQNLMNVLGGQYKVTVTDAKGCTATKTFIMPTYVKNNELETTSDVRIYPNPSAGILTVETLSDYYPNQITLSNVLGQSWKIIPISFQDKDANTIRFQLDVSSFENGAYFLKMELNGQQIALKRLIITKTE